MDMSPSLVPPDKHVVNNTVGEPASPNMIAEDPQDQHFRKDVSAETYTPWNSQGSGVKTTCLVFGKMVTQTWGRWPMMISGSAAPSTASAKGGDSADSDVKTLGSFRRSTTSTDLFSRVTRVSVWAETPRDLPVRRLERPSAAQEVAGLFQLAKHAAGKPLKVAYGSESFGAAELGSNLGFLASLERLNEPLLFFFPHLRFGQTLDPIDVDGGVVCCCCLGQAS